MLNISRKSGREVIKIMACDWRQTQCTSNHLLRKCPIYKALSNKEKLDHILRTRRCFNCYKKGHRASACTSVIRCVTCKKEKEKHNTALHEAWQGKTEVIAFLTRNVLPISLLTSPIMVGTDNSSLKMETNLIHDNGSLISLMSKDIADAIGLHGQTKPLGLSTIEDKDVIKQAFKSQINVHDTDGKEVGKERPGSM
jgi:hypothetical protein